MPSCAASLAAEPVPAEVPLEGLLADDEPPDVVPPDDVPPVVVPPDDVPLVEPPVGDEAPPAEPPVGAEAPLAEPPVGDEAPLAPEVVDPDADPELPPPQAVSAAASAKARGNRKALISLESRLQGH